MLAIISLTPIVFANCSSNPLFFSTCTVLAAVGLPYLETQFLTVSESAVPGNGAKLASIHAFNCASLAPFGYKKV